MRKEPPFDFAFVGAGLASTCLLRRLVARGLSGRVLVVDPGRDVSHHTYAFWSEAETALADVVERSWSRLRVASDGGALDLPLERHRYHMFRLGRLFERAREELAGADVTWVLRFLDERLSGREVLGLLRTLPPAPFVRALGRRMGR